MTDRTPDGIVEAVELTRGREATRIASPVVEVLDEPALNSECHAALYSGMAHPLCLVAYDSMWPARFESEKARLRQALGGLVTGLEHVGSTAVPGLAGKPVLDIAIAVADESAASACVAPLENLGYQYRGPHGDDPRRRYYVCDKREVRIAQIHLYILPATAWDDKLAFRDALRSDAELASAYAAEKYRVAEAVAWDKRAYSITKGPFIERVLSASRGDNNSDGRDPAT